MYDVVQTGSLYDDAVLLLQRYRRLMTTMSRSKKNRLAEKERELERLGERISERLSELSYQELLALDCWKDGVESGFYEVDVEALMERPYRSIRKVERWTEEYDVDEQSACEDAEDYVEPDPELVKRQREMLERAMRSPFDDGL